MADVMGQARSQVVITFKLESGKTWNFNVANPKEDVSEDEIRELAEHILTHKMFEPGMDPIVSVVRAKVTASETDKFDLA